MSTTDLGYPYPVGSDTTDVPADIQALAQAVDAAPGVPRLTQTQIDALTTTQKRAGRIVFNTTTGKHQRSNGSTWENLPDRITVATTEPAGLAVGDAWLDSSTSI